MTMKRAPRCVAGWTPANKTKAREALIDAFYTDLSFGTGGLRGKMGPGTNRINATTIANATQGLANHLKKVHGEAPADTFGAWLWRATADTEAKSLPKSRRKSSPPMDLSLDLSELRPTPQLSWTVRELSAVGGVVVTAITASIYNGYKVYASDGGQVVAPKRPIGR